MTPTDRADLSVQFMRPAPELLYLVSGYHIYSAGPVGSPVWEELFFPGWTNIRLTLADGAWHCGPVGSALAPVPPLSLFGPSSRGLHSRSHGGLMVGIGITPMGWHRFFPTPAHALADRIVPLDDHMAEIPAGLLADAQADPSPPAIKAVFDSWLIASLRPASRSADHISALFDWLTATTEVEIAAMHHHLGLTDSQLRRLSRNHFGFAPKMLLRRARFLKSITRIISEPDKNWSGTIEESYFDYAHFVRDCQQFLGMAPRQFLALDRPMTRLSLATRTRQLGAPLQALHRTAPLPDSAN